jgi:hypothetical protein
MKPFSVAAAVSAGAAGGTAEMLWVAAYSAAAPASGLEVARQVAATVLPATAGLSSAPLIGVLIHMALSIALGLALAKLLLGRLAPRHGCGALIAAALGTLAAVWAINFFVILPLLNPAFVTLLPFAVTLASKLLFGLAMGMALAVPRGAIP